MSTFKAYVLDSQRASERTPRGSIFLQSIHLMILEHSSFLSYTSILHGFRGRVCARET